MGPPPGVFVTSALQPGAMRVAPAAGVFGLVLRRQWFPFFAFFAFFAGRFDFTLSDRIHRTPSMRPIS